MPVHCSWSKTSTMFVVGLLTLLRHGEYSLAKTLAGAGQTSSNDCLSRCIQEKKQTKDCETSCHSVNKRSLNQDFCNFNDLAIYVTNGKKAPGVAPVSVNYKQDKNRQLYESINLRWSLPDVPKVSSSDNSTKIADAIGFFVSWSIGNHQDCLAFPKDARNFTLNSSNLLFENMFCGAVLHLAVFILPLPVAGSLELKQFKCPLNKANTTEPHSVHWTYATAAPSYEIVKPAVNKSSKPSTTSLKTSNEMQLKSGICQSDVCKYVVVGSVVVVVAVAVIVVVISMVWKHWRGGKDLKVIVNEKDQKDYCYVSYFSEDGAAGDPSKSIVNSLMSSCDLRMVAVDVLAKTDLDNYYKLGPRKFSELYMHNACHVIVLVTKKYLDLCNINISVKQNKERRRVFEEIHYINRAQLEFPLFNKNKAPIQSEEQPSSNNINLLSIKNLVSSFENQRLPKKKFIAFLLEPLSEKLPVWMKDWPVYSWPKDKSDFLDYVGQQN